MMGFLKLLVHIGLSMSDRPTTVQHSIRVIISQFLKKKNHLQSKSFFSGQKKKKEFVLVKFQNC